MGRLSPAGCSGRCSGTEILGFVDDGDRARSQIQFAQPRFKILKRQVQARRQFPGDAEDAERIAAIGGQFNLDQRIV